MFAAGSGNRQQLAARIQVNEEAHRLHAEAMSGISGVPLPNTLLFYFPEQLTAGSSQIFVFWYWEGADKVKSLQGLPLDAFSLSPENNFFFQA